MNWQTARPVPGSHAARSGVQRKCRQPHVGQSTNALNQLTVFELAQGIELRATSFVGRVRLGDIEVTVHPKITGAPLLEPISLRLWFA